MSGLEKEVKGGSQNENKERNGLEVLFGSTLKKRELTLTEKLSDPVLKAQI